MQDNSIHISPKREANIRQGFPYISWDFQNAALHRFGLWGDRAAYKILGQFGPLRLRLLTYGPGGSEQSLRIMDDAGKRIRTIRPAPFNKAEEIHHILMKESSRRINPDWIR